MGSFTIPPDDQPAVFPEGHTHWFFRCFHWLCGKPVKLDTVEPVFHTLVCNCAVYTTDGRFFYGYYTPDAAEDLDPFSMMPPDFVFCCHCCCYACCGCFRKRYDAEWKREADLFFGKGKEECPHESPQGAPKESADAAESIVIECVSVESIPLEGVWGDPVKLNWVNLPSSTIHSSQNV